MARNRTARRAGTLGRTGFVSYRHRTAHHVLRDTHQRLQAASGAFRASPFRPCCIASKSASLNRSPIAAGTTRRPEPDFERRFGKRWACRFTPM
jgi:hypothetical protein